MVFRFDNLIFLCLVFTSHLGSKAFAQEQMLPVEIQEALRSNGQALSPLTVDWTLQRHSDRTIEKLLEDLGTKRYDFYRPEFGSSSVNGVEFFMHETLERTPPKFAPNSIVFDKKEYANYYDGYTYFYSAGGAIKHLDVSLPESVDNRNDVGEGAYVRLGFMVGGTELPISSILHHLQNGGRLLNVTEENLDAAHHAVIELAPQAWTYPYWKDRQYKYYLDIEKGYAVSQIEWFLPGGRLLCRIKNSGWKQLSAPKLWLPTKSVREWYTWHFCPDKSFDEVFFYEDYSMELSRKVWPKTRFSPDLDEPGLVVSDPRPYAASKPGASWNESSKKWTYTNPPKFENISSPKSNYLRWLLIANLVVLGFLLVRYQLRRAK